MINRERGYPGTIVGISESKEWIIVKFYEGAYEGENPLLFAGKTYSGNPLEESKLKCLWGSHGVINTLFS